MSRPIGESLVTRRDGGLRKRSVTIAGHPTSVSLEQPFWDALAEIARGRGMSLNALVAEIDSAEREVGLSAAIRLYVLAHYRARAAHGDRISDVGNAEGTPPPHC